MTKAKSLHKAKNNPYEPPLTSAKAVDAFSVQECRKLLDNWTSSDAEVITMRDALIEIINTKLNEALNGKRKGSNILPSIK
ncbi:MAG: hypothetical protein ACK5N8_01565 [Alphaproteobacteria bacterium]